MTKRIGILLLCLCLLSFVGCGKKNDKTSSEDKTSSVAPQASTKPSIVNPLTGMADITADKADDRPVAIMVNNITTAQPVQTGIGQADIVYETEVEGGITRLMAVFQDVSKVDKIGTVRSARYAYVDLAMGHNAIYVHHGQDETYCGPHLDDTDDFTVAENNYGVRIKNGLASEHTLYAYGEKLWNGLVKDGWKTEKKDASNWQTFADPDKAVTLSQAANSVSVQFSTSYNSTFKYDAESGKYTRYANGTLRKDYNSGDTFKYKNVFVLLTSIKDYSDAYHRQIALDGGDGYYCVNGTYVPIKWTKGKSSSPIKFTNVDGTELTVNAGNSWVCIADKSTSQPSFE